MFKLSIIRISNRNNDTNRKEKLYIFASRNNVPIIPMEHSIRYYYMDEKIIKTLTSKIRSKRAELGFSQEYMANRLHISQNVYSQNERNIGNVPFARILRIMILLDIHFRDL